MVDFMTRKWKKYLVMVAKNGFAFGVDSEYFLLQFVLEVQTRLKKFSVYKREHRSFNFENKCQ